MPSHATTQRLHACEQGFALLEVVIASTLFVIVATSLVGLLVSSTSITTLAKERTVAEQGVSNQIERIRAMDYDLVGTVGGNPSGELTGSAAFSGINGEDLGVGATMTTQVTYASANVPGAAVTNADFKKVVVRIVRTRDSKVLAQAVTYLAPKNRPSQTTATAIAKVVDYGSNTAVSGVTVSLATGPSAPASDTTDAGGSVTFSGLTPNPTSGPQAYYDLSVTPPFGYVALSDTVSPKSPAHVQLSPTQQWSTVLDIYKPVTIGVALVNPDGTTFTGNASVTVTSPRPSPSGTSHTFAYTGSALTITTLSPPSGELLVPNLTYSITVTATGYATVNDSGTVPASSYPTNLTRSFVETMTQPPGTLDVTVQEIRHRSNGTNTTITCHSAPVSVTGGPASVSLNGQTTSTGGAASFTNLTPGGGYTVSALSSLSGLSNVVNNVTVNVGPTATALTVNLGTASNATC